MNDKAQLQANRIKVSLERIIATGQLAQNKFDTDVKERGLLHAMSWSKGIPAKLYAAAHAKHILEQVAEGVTFEKVHAYYSELLLSWHAEQSSSSISNAVQLESFEALQEIIRTVKYYNG